MAKTSKTDAEKREALRAKIEAGEQRNAERTFAEQARNAADGALEYVKANPFKAVAAVAAGALIIGAMTRPGRRAGRKAGSMAAVATDAALAYALGLLDSAGNAAGRGQERLSEMGGALGGKARAWQSAAGRETSDIADYVLRTVRRNRKRASKSVSDLRSRLSH